MNEDLELHLYCPVIPSGVDIYCSPRATKDRSRLHQFGTKMLPGISEFWRRLDRRLDHRGLSRPKFTSRGSSPKKWESRTCTKCLSFFAQMVPQRQAGLAQRHTLRHQRVESFDAKGADISEADRDAVGAREDFWSMSGDYLSPLGHAQRTIGSTERVIIPNAARNIDIVRGKTNFGQFGREHCR